MLRYPVGEYLRYPPAVVVVGAIKETAHDLWAAMTITWTMLDRINRCFAWGLAGSVAWLIRIGMNITL